MIARVWHGTTAAGKAEAYRDYVVRTGVADYQATAGNKGAFLLLTIQEEIAHFLVISFWESYESIKEFAVKKSERRVITLRTRNSY